MIITDTIGNNSNTETMIKKQLRVLIADDSVLMRFLIRDILVTDPIIDIVGFANNGKEAHLLTKELLPDVVLMDLTMGEYGGLYAVEHIMEDCPTPIVILSAIGNTDMEPILMGLKLGAIDYLNKPAKNSVHLRDVGTALIEKVKMASKVALTKKTKKEAVVNINEHSFNGDTNYDIIIIGASTGGPTAVETVLRQLPQNLNIPVIIIQHMPPNFVYPFAARLNLLTPLEVKVAETGEVLKNGTILLAPGDENMILETKKNKVVVNFTNQKFTAYNHPSVDSVMLSAATVYGKRCIGVVLTGMGRDGTEGLLAIKKAGGYTIAQNKDSCVVFGMPRAAVESGAVTQVVALNEIGGFLVSCLS